MAIVLRCNVFQLAAPEPGIRIDPAEVGRRFDETAKMTSVLMGGKVELAVAKGPVRLTIPNLKTARWGIREELRRAILRLPDFATWRHDPTFGVIHACYVDHVASEPDPRGGGHLNAAGFCDFPFLYVEETPGERVGASEPRWLVLLHELGHALLGDHHVAAEGNLMSEGRKALHLTPEQRVRFLRVAGNIAATGRRGLWR